MLLLLAQSFHCLCLFLLFPDRFFFFFFSFLPSFPVVWALRSSSNSSSSNWLADSFFPLFLLFPVSFSFSSFFFIFESPFSLSLVSFLFLLSSLPTHFVFCKFHLHPSLYLLHFLFFPPSVCWHCLPALLGEKQRAFWREREKEKAFDSVIPGQWWSDPPA